MLTPPPPAGSPGILLMVFDDSVKSLSLTVDSVEISGTYEANEQRPLFSHTATITGIDTPPLMIIMALCVTAFETLINHGL